MSDKCDCAPGAPANGPNPAHVERQGKLHANYLANHAAYLMGADPTAYYMQRSAAPAPVLSPREQGLAAQAQAQHLAALLGAAPPNPAAGTRHASYLIHNLANTLGADSTDRTGQRAFEQSMAQAYHPPAGYLAK